ncbi:MAG: hypothetical protein Q6L50_06070 [Gloeomargarita sp. GMQP_bins_120]
MVNALITLAGLMVAMGFVLPWLQEWQRASHYRVWTVTVGLASLTAVGLWWETGLSAPGAIAGAGAFALGGLVAWQGLARPERQRVLFDQTLTQLLTGQQVWDGPTVERLSRLAPPEERPRLQATLRYLYEQHPELRATLAPFVEQP